MPDKTRFRLMRALSILAASSFLILAISQAVPSSSSAGGFFLTVFGFVRDSENNVVVGAQVDILDQDTGYSKTVYSDEDGQYTWNIPETEWFDGDLIKIHATFGSAYGDAQAYAEDVSPWNLRIDVTLSEAIPEFGSALGVLVAVFLVGVVAVVGVGAKRRSS